MTATREQKAEYARAYRVNNKEKLAAQRRARNEANPERRREIMRKFRETHPFQQREYNRRDPVGMLLRSARKRAKKRGIDFNLTREDIVVPSHCPVLGIELKPGVEFGFRDTAPTLDRVDNSKGYIKANVAVISWRANRIKCDATLDELRRVLSYAGAWRAE